MAHCYWLNINEHEEISFGLAQKFTRICREVNHNTANGQVYRAVKAQHRDDKLRHLA